VAHPRRPRIRRERGTSATLIQAETVVASTTPEDTRTALTHGDMWYGNTLWNDDGDLTALLDWDAAGIGSPGIDLGSVRLDAALCYGQGAVTEVQSGWEHEAGRPDLIGLLNDRREAFLRAVLSRLNSR
jgi:aminoglycoside phosphotransferase (APT) family kinase protein